MEMVKRHELRRIGHDCLSAINPESASNQPLSPQEAIDLGYNLGVVGILATLLRIEQDQSEIASALQAIAKDLSRLVGIQNMARLVEEL